MRVPPLPQNSLISAYGLAFALAGSLACQSSSPARDDGGPPAGDGPVATGGASTSGPPTDGSAAGGRTGTAGQRGPGGAETGGHAMGGALGSTGGGGGSMTGLDACGRPVAIVVPPGYVKLAWHDEFDSEGLPSSADWGYEQGFARNEELQWYQTGNAVVTAGRLLITAKRESKANPNYKAGSSDWKTSRQTAAYTSSSLTTSGKQSWQYGRFEMCAKIPIDSGLWPAWWTLGVSGEWPSNGEIDIMEFYQGKILANVACGTSTRWEAKWDSVTKAVDATWASRYHVWRMDWDSTKIDLYVDDALLNTAKLADMLNADGSSPFKQRAYMIVNLAIGGQNGGDPAGTTFPKTYEIDYLRVFQ